MSEPLRMIAEEVSNHTHVVLVLHGTGWHKAHRLVTPMAIALLLLPP